VKFIGKLQQVQRFDVQGGSFALW